MKTRIIGAFLALLLASGGAFMLVNYVQGADARAAAGAELTDVYLVEKTIPAGTLGESVSEFVEVDSMPTRNVAEGNVTDLSELAGLVADAELLPGEQLLEARFVDPAARAAAGEIDVPAGMQQLSFALPVQRVVGGSVIPGSTVGLVMTLPVPGVDIKSGEPMPAPESSFQFNRLLVTNVEIGTSYSRGGTEDESEEESGDMIMLTVAVGTHDAERLVWAMEGYEQAGGYGYTGVWLTLQDEATDTAGSAPVNESNVRQ